MIINNEKIRILGKGITALALKDKFPNATLYDDNDFNEYDLNSLTVSPNPSDGVFQVHFTSLVPSAEVAFSVYDILGKKLFEKKVTFNDTGFEVNLVDYPKGVYFLRITVGNSIINKKLIKK